MNVQPLEDWTDLYICCCLIQYETTSIWVMLPGNMVIEAGFKCILLSCIIPCGRGKEMSKRKNGWATWHSYPGLDCCFLCLFVSHCVLFQNLKCKENLLQILSALKFSALVMMSYRQKIMSSLPPVFVFIFIYRFKSVLEVSLFCLLPFFGLFDFTPGGASVSCSRKRHDSELPF